jgi:predicted nucleic acid-binding protein
VSPDEVPEGLLLVDTNVFSWIAWRRYPYERYLPLVQGHELALSFVTVAELRYGAIKNDDWGLDRKNRLETIIRSYDAILPASDAVCDLWAQIYLKCRGKLSGPGQGINDMWIAACALAQPEPVPLVTDNVRDFGVIAAAFPLVLVYPD